MSGDISRDQLPQEDSLLERGDPLDEGYSPLDRIPATHRIGTTGAEEREGESLDQRLDQEVPDLDPARVDDGTWWETMPADARAGRLVAPDEGAHEDVDSELIGDDVGIDGGAASAEEAAVHVVGEFEPFGSEL